MLIRYASLPIALSCLFAVACGSGGQSPSGPGAVGPGTGTLSGPQSFPVARAVMAPSSACGPSTVPGGGFAAAQIILLEDSEASLLCARDGGTLSGRILDIEIATSQYAAMTTPLTDALTPGTYAVGNEQEDDPDLCMLPTGTTAFAQLLNGTGGEPSSLSVSGSVSITSVSASAIAGSFDVTMGGPFGQTDGGTPQLSGSFNATACP